MDFDQVFATLEGSIITLGKELTTKEEKGDFLQ